MLIIGLIICLSTSIHSANGSFHAAVRYSGGSELVTETFELYDHSGDIIYAKKDIPLSTFFISNAGSVFALNEHRLCFYRRDGSETMLRELVYPNGFGFSPDNSLFFASDRDGVFAYSPEGILIHAYRPGRLFASNGSGESVAIVSTDTLFVYHDGVLMDTEIVSSPYSREIYFSRDGDSIMVELQDNIEIYDTRTRSWVKRR